MKVIYTMSCEVLAACQENTEPVVRRPRGITISLALVLTAITFAAHFPAIRGDYIWDDDTRVFQNPLMHSLSGLWQCWVSLDQPDYWPLTRTTFWIEWQLWGDNPHPYHVVNIALHALSAVILWRLLRQLGLSDPGAFLGSLLFAVHPVTVESVAWITERKNVLSMVLYLLSIVAYLRFEDRLTTRWYLLALMTALAALLAKSSIVALPIVLLILAWWRHERITRRDILRLVPFVTISGILGLIERWYEHQNCIVGEIVRPEGLASRIAAVGWVVWFYLYKIIAPFRLMMIYPRWDVDGSRILHHIPLALLLACFAVLWRYRNSWGRGPLAALGSFVVVLMPVLGILDMSYARFSLVSDHLQYPGMPGIMALIGCCIAAVWSWTRRNNRPIASNGIAAVTLAAVMALAVLSWRQASIYQNSITLWTHNIQLNNRSWTAYMNRGNTYNAMGAFDQAIQDYTRAIQVRPNYADALNNRGAAYGNKGNFVQELKDSTAAIAVKPDYADAYNNRGNAYNGLGAYEEAIREYSHAIALKPHSPSTYFNRSGVYAKKRDYDRAIEDLTKVITMEPRNFVAFSNRAEAYAEKRQYHLALQDYTKAIELNPNSAEGYMARGTFFGWKGDHFRACQDFTQAIELNPRNPQTYASRALAFYFLKDYAKASADLTTCRQLGGTAPADLSKALAEATAPPKKHQRTQLMRTP